MLDPSMTRGERLLGRGGRRLPRPRRVRTSSVPPTVPVFGYDPVLAVITCHRTIDRQLAGPRECILADRPTGHRDAPAGREQVSVTARRYPACRQRCGVSPPTVPEIDTCPSARTSPVTVPDVDRTAGGHEVALDRAIDLYGPGERVEVVRNGSPAAIVTESPVRSLSLDWARAMPAKTVGED